MEKESSVRKLIKAVESVMDAYADNLNSISKGESIKYMIEDKTIDLMIKIIKEINSFEQFEKIANPEISKSTKSNDKKKTISNFYEHALEKVKNGSTRI